GVEAPGFLLRQDVVGDRAAGRTAGMVRALGDLPHVGACVLRSGHGLELRFERALGRARLHGETAERRGRFCLRRRYGRPEQKQGSEGGAVSCRVLYGAMGTLRLAGGWCAARPRATLRAHCHALTLPLPRDSSGLDTPTTSGQVFEDAHAVVLAYYETAADG